MGHSSWNPVKSVFKSPVKAIKSLAKGDIGGAINSAVNTVSLGTLGVTEGGLINLAGQEKMPNVQESSAVDTLTQEAESTAKKRKSMYFTEGEELGQDVTRVFNTQKRGSIFN